MYFDFSAKKINETIQTEKMPSDETDDKTLHSSSTEDMNNDDEDDDEDGKYIVTKRMQNLLCWDFREEEI